MSALGLACPAPSCPILPVPLLYPQLTVYLGKRDFVDHLDKVDPVGKCVQKAAPGPQDRERLLGLEMEGRL